MHKLKKQEHKISMWVTNVIVSESRKALENRSSRREESLIAAKIKCIENTVTEWQLSSQENR